MKHCHDVQLQSYFSYFIFNLCYLLIAMYQHQRFTNMYEADIIVLHSLIHGHLAKWLECWFLDHETMVQISQD